MMTHSSETSKDSSGCIVAMNSIVSCSRINIIHCVIIFINIASLHMRHSFIIYVAFSFHHQCILSSHDIQLSSPILLAGSTNCRSLARFLLSELDVTLPFSEILKKYKVKSVNIIFQFLDFNTIL